MQVFLEYTEKGFIKTSYYGVALGAHLAALCYAFQDIGKS